MTSLPRSLCCSVLALLLGAPGLPALASSESEIAFHRGVRAFGVGDWTKARAHFEAALEAEPSDVAALHYLGLVAQRQGDPRTAAALYTGALAMQPDAPDVLFDRGTAWLLAGMPSEARSDFDAVLRAQPERADARLFAGIARYREADYDGSLLYLEDETGLDPGQRLDARYYAGLAHANLGNPGAASAAFSAVESHAPTHPLARAVSSFGYSPGAPSRTPRRWRAELTTGFERDSNATFLGSIPAVLQPDDDKLNRQSDWSAVGGLRARYDVYESEVLSIVAGYDGFASFHEDLDEVDRQIHVGSLAASYRLEPVTLGLLYEASYSFVGHADDFERAHRVTASAALPTAEWGVLRGYAQVQDLQFFIDDPVVAGGGFESRPFDRDGQRYTVGLLQYVFLPGNRSHLRLGVAMDRLDSHGNEYRYDGFEFQAGYGVALPRGSGLTLLWQHARRNYGHTRVLDLARRGSSDEILDLVSAKLEVPLNERLMASFSVSALMTDSDVGVYDYNRAVVGAYLTYRF